MTEQDRLWCPCSSASCLQLKKPLPQIRALQQSRLLLESQGKDTPPPKRSRRHQLAFQTELTQGVYQFQQMTINQAT